MKSWVKSQVKANSNPPQELKIKIFYSWQRGLEALTFLLRKAFYRKYDWTDEYKIYLQYIKQ